jgi:chromosome segregation protein
VQELQDRQRAASDAAQQTGTALADIAARAEALSALQAKIGQGKDSARWLDDKGLANARRLWQGLDIEPGWEDALEAVLRERLNAVELPSSRVQRDWHDVRAGDDGGPAARRRLRARC